MWKWTEDPRYYLPSLWTVTAVFVVLPAVVWAFFPAAALFVFLYCLSSLLGIWREHLAPRQAVNLKIQINVDAHMRQTTSLGAVISRLRLAAFGALTTIATYAVLIKLAPIEVPAYVLTVGTILCLLGIPASIFSTRVTMWMMETWRLVSDIPLDALSVYIAFAKRGANQIAAFQKLYNFENWLYMMVSGYGTSFTFRSNPDWLRGNLQRIGSFS